MRNEQLENILTQWAKDYGEGQPQWLGYPKTNILHEKHGLGRPPEHTRGKTISDLVEGIVSAMDGNDYWKHSCVIRCHYFASKHPLETRLDKLAKLGVRVNKDAYYDYIKAAHMTIDIGLRLVA